MASDIALTRSDRAAPTAGVVPSAGPGPTAGRRPGASPPRGRWWRRPSRWTLRTRLLVVLTALLAGVSLVIVVTSTLALRGYLLDQVDGQLATSGRLPMPPPGAAPPDGKSVFVLGQRQGTLSILVTDGEITRADLLTDTGPVGLAASDMAEVAKVPVDGHAHSVDIDGLGTYRLLAAPPTNGTVRVTGLPLDEVNATIMWMVAVASGVALAGTAAAGVVGAVIIRRALRPLRRVAATAARVTALPLDRGEVALAARVPTRDTDPRTEVGQVGAALNRMLGHVEAALAARHASETRVRQFVADASHELRTPLAAISGYAQLVRRTPGRVPDDVAYAMGRVESESARMTSLVEDLLLLARLDSGRPLVLEPVDLSRLVVDVVSDAHVAAPSHQFVLDLPDDPVCVEGDAARLHQVLANLLANTRTHTPPGTRVVTRLTADDHLRAAEPTVRLTVADDGPGIPAALLPNVFERFARGETSRTRASGSASTGLGLAIVAAVVDAHHGRVEATSVPGRTVFTVSLPAGVGTVPAARRAHGAEPADQLDPADPPAAPRSGAGTDATGADLTFVGVGVARHARSI